jgi:hypothetical protein
VFGAEVVTAMIDRLVHHAEVIALKATATASKTETSRVPAARQARRQLSEGSVFSRR